MKSFFILILVSLLGAGFAIGLMYVSGAEKPTQGEALPVMKLPYNTFIAGTGIVESASKNIYVGALVSGKIKRIYVESGTKVKKGDLLFEMDDSIESNKIPLLKAEINVAKSRLDSARQQLNLIENFRKITPDLITKEKYTSILNEVNQTREAFLLSQTKLKSFQESLNNYKVYAPVDGVILQSLVTEGSFFDANSKALVMGSETFNVRISINEFDAWKFEPNSEAMAYIRGNPKQELALVYDHTIPFVVPKLNLTGLGTEATDTRVLQVMYTVKKRPDFPLYVGEMLDVFVQTTKDK